MVVLLTEEDPETHTHACGHDCYCEIPTHDVCDRCHIGVVVVTRYPSRHLTIPLALANLYLSLHSIAMEGKLDGIS